jgi:hypothetical protein
VHCIEAGAVHEQRAGKMSNGAGAARSVVDIARLRIGHELGNGLGRDRGADAEDERPGAEDADRDKVLLGIVVDLLQLRYDGNLRRGGEEQRVAVGRGLRHVGGGERAPCPDPVFDDKTLLEVLGQLLARHACHHVGVAAGGVAHDHRHRLGGPVRRLRERRAWQQRRRRDKHRRPHNVSPKPATKGEQQTAGRRRGCDGG